MSISSRRWNELISAVNKDTPPEMVVPPLANDEEKEKYQSLVRELAMYREINPQAAFSPVELDSDDEALDIYRD